MTTEGDSVVYEDPLLDTLAYLMEGQDGVIVRARLEGFIAGLGLTITPKKRRTGS